MIRCKRFIILVLAVLIFFVNPQVAKAETKDIADIDAFESLSGDSKYLGKTYRDNYYLDIEKTGMLESMEKAINDCANILFGIVKTGAYLVVSIFYFTMDFDVGKLLAPQINAIQDALNKSIFWPLFGLAFAGASFILIKRMIKRDMIGAGTEILKVIGIIVLSTLVVTQSGTVLSYATNITKEASKDALTGIKNDGGGTGLSMSSYAASAAGSIWETLVHNPWKSLEFGNSSYEETDVEAFLTTSPGTDERKALVKDFDQSCFDKTRGVGRVVFLIIYLIPFFINCGVYMMVAIIQLLFQVLAVVYVLFAPLVLVLALIPGYESGIPSWLKKILETQISILIITFMMGLLIKMNDIVYALRFDYGWFVALVFQTIIAVGLVLKRNEILHMFSNLQSGVSRAGYAKASMIKSGNLYQSYENRKNRKVSRGKKGNG